jgi:hypothetical protein
MCVCVCVNILQITVYALFSKMTMRWVTKVWSLVAADIFLQHYIQSGSVPHQDANPVGTGGFFYGV